MWEVISYGERPYWEMSNQDVSVLEKLETHVFSCVLFKLKSALLISNISTNIISTEASWGGRGSEKRVLANVQRVTSSCGDVCIATARMTMVFRSLINENCPAAPVFNTSQLNTLHPSLLYYANAFWLLPLLPSEEMSKETFRAPQIMI